MTPHAGLHVPSRTVEFTSREVIARTIAQLEGSGEGFRIPLFRAASIGALNLAMAFGGALVHSRVLKQRSPTVVVLPDDQPAATGPDAWPQARKLARWAKAVALHATGGQAKHYERFAQATVRHGRVLVVEIEHRHLDAWLDLVLQERKSDEVLCLVPLPGGQHPVTPAQAGAVIH